MTSIQDLQTEFAGPARSTEPGPGAAEKYAAWLATHLHRVHDTPGQPLSTAVGEAAFQTLWTLSAYGWSSEEMLTEMFEERHARAADWVKALASPDAPSNAAAVSEWVRFSAGRALDELNDAVALWKKNPKGKLWENVQASLAEILAVTLMAAHHARFDWERAVREAATRRSAAA